MDQVTRGIHPPLGIHEQVRDSNRSKPILKPIAALRTAPRPLSYLHYTPYGPERTTSLLPFINYRGPVVLVRAHYMILQVSSPQEPERSSIATLVLSFSKELKQNTHFNQSINRRSSQTKNALFSQAATPPYPPPPTTPSPFSKRSAVRQNAEDIVEAER